ncbi:MAG: 30S ribosomal protein S17 [Candidatus Omnitrophica bacterium]|nr:30S ribosomal protein S17 [Candidatus Omnitrophota bacterium]MBU4473335.1 30S ribosomal protein S17 [Candidatus Omnitrophota bacterium]MCG2706630.1 30S ribosomal protein S17 [Candidatus Omnitrophota bacterium]
MAKRKEFIGTVISDRMQKSIIVKITQMKKQPKYGRIIKNYTKFKVHDEKNVAKIGDIVRIQETRPLSRDKRFRLLEVTKKAQTPHVDIKEQA